MYNPIMAANSLALPSRKQFQPIAKKYGLRFIVLFGSAARGGTHRESDIDIGVYTEQAITFDKRLKLWMELSGLFQEEIDLAVLNHPNPLFGFRVANEGKVLFEREPFAWERWRSYTIRYYWDTAKFRQDADDRLARNVEKIRHAAP